MKHINLITRRGFLDRSSKVGLGVFLSTLVDIPLVVKRALAEGSIGINGKKLLFIFLRGANDSLNSIIPMKDDAYVDSRLTVGGNANPNFGRSTNRPDIVIPPDSLTDYALPGGCDFPVSGTGPTFGYAKGIRLGNGFAALNPSLKFLAPVYNAGDLGLIHRVGYPKQSQSHFDSQNYWETGNPNNNLSRDGIFYRTIIESGLANTRPLTGVSIQSSLPLLLRGSAAALTNLSDVTRYDLLGVPTGTSTAGTNGNLKADAAIRKANGYAFPEKLNRELLSLQYQNLMNTLPLFEGIKTEMGVNYTDDENTDGDFPYSLFPASNDSNGGYLRSSSPRTTDPAKYVVDTVAYSYFTSLKAAAFVLNRTDAMIAGTQLDGFDTHMQQGGVTGNHSDLQRRIGWSMYSLWKYFRANHDKVTWDNLIVVTLSEFGRTTVQNSDMGTDHAEAGAMILAGGGIKGYGSGSPNGTGVYNCGPNDSIPWITGPTGSMFGKSSRYLKRCTDYRSVLGEVIRKHLGATSGQLGRIIPGYVAAGENLSAGPTSLIDNTPITGELGIL